MRFKRLSLGKWPTPLIEHSRFGNFAIKRDDLSGYGRAGIKTRKLEGALAYLQEKGYTDLVIIVPNISNLRSDLELFASQHALKLHLIVSNEPRLSAEKRTVPGSNNIVDYTIAGDSVISVAFLLIKKYLTVLGKGKKVALYLPSLSHPSSIMGAANGLIELYLQYKEMNRPFPKHLFVSACTGSSAAGLILSSIILKKHGLEEIQVHVAKVFPGALKYWIWLLIWWTKLKNKLDIRVKLSDIQVGFKYKEIPYGRADEHLKKICESVKQDFGISIDPIYGARAWGMMTDFIDSTYTGDGLVYWHCGYTPDWHSFE